MKSKGGNARSGDVIPYVFCLAEGEETAKSAQADRAKHPDEVRRAVGELKIGMCLLSPGASARLLIWFVRLRALSVSTSSSTY